MLRMIVLLILVGAASIPAAYGQRTSAHEPIVISSDNEFSIKNGIVAGGGTSSSPYIIHGWTTLYIIVRNTTSYFVISNVIADWILLEHVSNARLIESKVTHGDSYAVTVNFSREVIISKNTVVGIAVSSTQNLLIEENSVVSSSQGVLFNDDLDTANITVVRNNISGHFFGVRTSSHGGPIIIRENNILGNAYGIEVHGTHRRGLFVFHNNFISNGVDARFWETSGDNFTWDNYYPDGGNYWSGYTGSDRCGGPEQNICPRPDGIGDIPFHIDVYSVACGQSVCTLNRTVDRYPLIRPVPDLIGMMRLN